MLNFWSFELNLFHFRWRNFYRVSNLIQLIDAKIPLPLLLHLLSEQLLLCLQILNKVNCNPFTCILPVSFTVFSSCCLSSFTSLFSEILDSSFSFFSLVIVFDSSLVSFEESLIFFDGSGSLFFSSLLRCDIWFKLQLDYLY